MNSKFTFVKIDAGANGQLTAEGPFVADPEDEAKRVKILFAIVQEIDPPPLASQLQSFTIVGEGERQPHGDKWEATVEKPDPPPDHWLDVGREARGVGLAIVIKDPTAPRDAPSFQAYTWCERIDVTAR